MCRIGKDGMEDGENEGMFRIRIMMRMEKMDGVR